MREAWRPVPGWPYEVSDRGRVRRGGRVLRPAVAGKGYLRVTLCCRGVRRYAYIHALVLEGFADEPRPYGAVVRHLDGDPTNNVLPNLVYGTQSENLLDRRRHGTVPAKGRRVECPQGHPYDETNTYVTKIGYKMCRACNRQRHWIVRNVK